MDEVVNEARLEPLPVQSEDGRQYFVYVEEVQAIPPRQVYVGPAGDRIDVSSREGRMPRLWPISVRFSGIEAETFDQVVGEFEPLDLDEVTPEQRHRRRSDIRKFLSDKDLPIFQAVIPADDDIWLPLRHLWREGHWCRLNFLPDKEVEGSRHLFMAVPEIANATSERLRLISVERIDSVRLRRLQDIFSLVHLQDADFMDDAESGRGPLPPSPSGREGDDAAGPESQTGVAPDGGNSGDPDKPGRPVLKLKTRKESPGSAEAPPPAVNAEPAFAETVMAPAASSLSAADPVEALEQSSAMDVEISYFVATRMENI